jgi:hypothetical protein
VPQGFAESVYTPYPFAFRFALRRASTPMATVIVTIATSRFVTLCVTIAAIKNAPAIPNKNHAPIFSTITP